MPKILKDYYIIIVIMILLYLHYTFIREPKNNITNWYVSSKIHYKSQNVDSFIYVADLKTFKKEKFPVPEVYKFILSNFAHKKTKEIQVTKTKYLSYKLGDIYKN